MTFLAFIFWLTLGAAQQTTNSNVDGRVFRTGTTEPVEGVRVTFTSDATPLHSVLTDRDGRFSLSNVIPGRYTVRLQHDGYAARSTSSAPSPQGSSVVDGSAVGTIEVGAQGLTNLAYFLIPGGTMSGRVLDTQGGPAAGANISALRLTYQDGRPIVALAKTAVANDRGEYRMFWMEPGEYFVRAEKPGSGRSYYADAENVSRAVKVSVSPGAESSRIDVSLRRATAFRITGNVRHTLSDVDVALDAVRFFLIPAESNGILEGGFAFQNQLLPADAAAGKFLLSVQAGSYELIAIYTDRRNSPARTFIGRASVDVPFRDTSDVMVVITSGIDLSGKLTRSGTAPLTTPTRVRLQPKGLFSVLPLAGLEASPAQDGTFTVFNVPDLPYSVSVDPLPPNAYIADILQGTFSVFDSGTIGVRGGPNTSFEISLDPQGATISGRVAASMEQLSTGVTAALIPDERRMENLTLYKRGTVSPAGTFSFTGIAPGRYRLFAWEGIPPSAEHNAEFRNAHRDSGAEITVGPGDTSTVELRVIPR